MAGGSVLRARGRWPLWRPGRLRCLALWLRHASRRLGHSAPSPSQPVLQRWQTRPCWSGGGFLFHSGPGLRSAVPARVAPMPIPRGDEMAASPWGQQDDGRAAKRGGTLSARRIFCFAPLAPTKALRGAEGGVWAGCSAWRSAVRCWEGASRGGSCAGGRGRERAGSKGSARSHCPLPSSAQAGARGQRGNSPLRKGTAAALMV